MKKEKREQEEGERVLGRQESREELVLQNTAHLLCSKNERRVGKRDREEKRKREIFGN